MIRGGDVPHSVKGSRTTAGAFDVASIKREIDYIVDRALAGDSRLVTLGPLIFFSTESGDAWMLDPADGSANCLCREGGRKAIQVEDRGQQVTIEWTASYRIEGEAMIFLDSTGRVTTVFGYPTRHIEAAAARLRR
jgi:hypothetical protein